jgi:hypothetical protein
MRERRKKRWTDDRQHGGGDEGGFEREGEGCVDDAENVVRGYITDEKNVWFTWR